jgi:methylated-DNA-[protein]-cysteine S-methyltransferase
LGRKSEEGKNDREKLGLLRGEGVRFDGRGKAVGRPWGEFR